MSRGTGGSRGVDLRGVRRRSGEVIKTKTFLKNLLKLNMGIIAFMYWETKN